LDHDEAGRLHYAPLQGELAAALRAANPVIPTELDTMVFVRDGPVYLRSQAVLQILRELPAPWSWFSVFRVFPSFLTDLGYRLLAANRYRIFGTLEACRIPEPAQAARFLD
jgi:predicted DCC family thiol-disulfide oxidoreductase YuxK